MMTPGRRLAFLSHRLGGWLKAERSIWVTASAVTLCVFVIRIGGLLQASELAAFDQMMRLRPTRSIDRRIVIVTIDDTDINQLRSWPVSDALLAEFLNKVKSYQPRVIGLDIYREFPVGSGYADLQLIFETTPGLIGIEKIADAHTSGVDAPAALQKRGQIGFNNVVADPDGRVRRAMLYWTLEDGPRTSFALQIAKHYLEVDGITPKPAETINPAYLQLGRGVFQRLQSNDGGYVRIDNGGYQILANPEGAFNRFATVSITDVLNNRVAPELMRDRIVLVGSTAISLKDFFYTSYSGGLTQDARPIAGVELQAHIVQQILSAAIDGRGLIRVWPNFWGWAWTFVWALAGATLRWQVRSPQWSLLGVVVLTGGLLSICYGAFLSGWWIPVVPPVFTLIGSVVGITGYIAYLEEELKKSKEFLHSVINTIPDPIYVKNKQHQWVVLNDAYCRFIGHSLDELLNHSEQDFLPTQEAAVIWQKDEQTFILGTEQESEEEFTNAMGLTRAIATKRSLHQDPAGNLFLVGVMRDITERKHLENELRQTAADLILSNAALRKSEDTLKYMAYHDPLTGLPNRKFLYEQLEQSIEWAASANQLIAILFLDLDGFKLINDSEGHLVGDLLLQAVAQRLIGCLRSSDIVVRLGGDEFVVVLPAIPTGQQISRVAQKILTTLSQSFVLEGKTISITTSIGISIYPQDGTQPETLITCADQAMYLAKGLGKNHYEFMDNVRSPMSEVKGRVCGDCVKVDSYE